MEHSEPHLLLFDGALAAEVVLASVEEGEWVSAVVIGGEIELMEARMSHGPVLAQVEKLRCARMEELLLGGLDAGQAVGDGVQGLHLLQESHQQLAELLIFCRGATGGGVHLELLGFVGFLRVIPHGDGRSVQAAAVGEKQRKIVGAAVAAWAKEGGSQES
jgi:hypothetical protein